MAGLVEALEAERAYLFAVAYRMLGSAAEAEDMLQEAAVRARAEQTPVAQPRAWLTTVVTRLCLDALKSAQRQRETYVGPWLPEPVLADAPPPPGPDARVGLAESVSMAFLVLLERLSPLERAVFLLREVFDHDFAEVAALLDRSEAACRQLFHRAKAHVEAGRPRFRPADETRQRLTQAFVQALQSGDAAAMARLLAEDVHAWSDGGGKVRAVPRPLQGRDVVARFLTGLASKAPRDARMELEEVNGQPGLLLHWGGALQGVVVLDVEGEHITGVRLVVNPDKLRALSAPSPAGRGTG